jgi:hypothetical protein
MAETERELLQKMDTTVLAIKKIRKCPKEKDVVLGYIERRNGTVSSQHKSIEEYPMYFHDFNKFGTPHK